jgi:hypothetical protein
MYLDLVPRVGEVAGVLARLETRLAAMRYTRAQAGFMFLIDA